MARFDPLLYDTPLPHSQIFYPLGFPVEITTNCGTILRAAEDLWREFEQTHQQDPIRVRLAVADTGRAVRPEPAMPRGQGHIVSTVHDAHNFAITDLRTGYSYGWFTPPVACDPAYFRYHFLEPHVLLALQALYLTPLHAACIARGGIGVLLCGDAEAGKSTLAYACARKGWSYVADDGSHLVRDSSTGTIAGNPYLIRLRADAPKLFPELSSLTPVERPNGKPSLEIRTPDLRITPAVTARAGFAVFLNRASGEQHLADYNRTDAFDRFAQFICVGEDSLREAQKECLWRFLRAVPVYEMHYQDLNWAEQTVRSLIGNASE